MSGNVWEWCQDEWHTNYQDAPTDGSAWESKRTSGPYRVIRGGSWFNGASSLRVAYRNGNSPVVRYFNLGFRPARTP